MSNFNISLFNNTASQQIQSMMDAPAASVPQNVEEAGRPVASAAPQATSPSSVATEIARLVKSAVGRNVSAVTAEELKGAAKSRSVKKSSDFAAALSMVKSAQDKLNIVGRLKGKDLMTAFCPAKGDDKTVGYNDNGSRSSEIRDLLEDAISAQEKLSSHLCNLLSKCKDGNEQQLIENMMLRADSRASELTTLAMQLSELAGSSDPNDADAKASIGSEKVKNLTAGMVGSMHGNLELATSLGTDPEMQSIMKDIADFAGTVSAIPEDGDSQKTIAGLLGRAADLRARLVPPDFKASDSKNPDFKATRVKIHDFKDSPLRAELIRQLDAGVANIKDRARKALSSAVNHLSIPVLRNFSELDGMSGGTIWNTFFQDTPLGRLIPLRNDLKAAVNAFAANPTPDNFKVCSQKLQELTGILFGSHGSDYEEMPDSDEVADACDKFYAQMDEMKASIEAREARQDQLSLDESSVLNADKMLFDMMTREKVVVHQPNGQTAEVVRKLTPERMLTKMLGFDRQAKQRLDLLQGYLEKMSSPDKFTQAGFAGADLEQLLVSDRPVLGVVEARVCGAQPEMMETTCLDQNRTSMVPLGSGAANDVSLVTYKVPGSDKVETRVFKGEITARYGTVGLSLEYNAWQDQQQIAKLNFAASSTAKFLGTEGVIAKTTLGTCDGQYGLFMEQAPGKEAGTFLGLKHYDADQMQITAPADRQMASMIKTIADGGYHPTDPSQKMFVASLVKGTIDLAWNDVLTGQGDRHPQNYMLGFQPNGTVRVTGIDNDMCFPAYKPGLQTFVCRDTLMEARVVQLIKDSVVNPDSSDQEQLKSDRNSYFEGLLNDPESGVSRNEKGRLTINVTKFTSPNVVRALVDGMGVRALAVPPFMSRAMHDKLNDANARAELVATWEKTLGPDSLAAAKSRLEELVNLSNSDQVKIIDNDEDWGSEKVVSTLVHDFNDASTGADFGGVTTSEEAKATTTLFTKNLVMRDFEFLFKNFEGVAPGQSSSVEEDNSNSIEANVRY